jgi:hypothetical protein
MKTSHQAALRLPHLLALDSLDAILAILPLAQLALADAHPTLAEPAPLDPPTLAARALSRALRRLDRAAERYADPVVDDAAAAHPPPADDAQLEMF